MYISNCHYYNALEVGTTNSSKEYLTEGEAQSVTITLLVTYKHD